MYEIRNELKEAWKDFAMLVVKGITFPYKIEVLGRENVPEERAIVAANHASFLDPLFLVGGLGIRIYFLAKHFIAPTENFDKSPYGRLLVSLDQILMKNGELDKNTLKKALAVLDSDDKNNKLGIFPEGMRSLDGKLASIHEGTAWISYLSETPIVPIGIKGSYEIWPRDRKFPKLYGKIKINIGRQLYPDYNLAKKESIKNLTEIMEKEISRLLCI